LCCTPKRSRATPTEARAPGNIRTSKIGPRCDRQSRDQ
jgi:hypothetical protein